MTKKYTKTFQINYPDIDPFQQLKLSRLFDFCTVVSYEQSDLVGIDPAYLSQRGINWIINEAECWFERFPRYKETITIDVYATTYNKFFIYRRFDLFAEDHQQIGSILMSLSLLRLETRKIYPISEEVGEAFGAEFSKRLYRFKRADNSQLPENPVHQIRPKYSHLDYNQHVYNIYYYEWMLDSLPMEFLKENQIKELAMRFEEEIALDEPVSVVSAITEDEPITTVLAIKSAEKEKAIATIVWQNVNAKEENKWSMSLQN